MSMSLNNHFLGWHKWKFGWVDDAQVKGVGGFGQIEDAISALGQPGGLKVVAVSTGPTTAYAIEVRERVGRDAGLCKGGVLIYKVDASTPSGSGPVRVVQSRDGGNASLVNRCGIPYTAPFEVGQRFEDQSAGVLVEILGKSGNDYRVRVTKR